MKSGATTRLLAQNRWWLVKKGVASRLDWLENKNNCQDLEMIAYTRRNYRSLLNNRESKKVMETLIDNADKAALAGVLAASHLLGAGGARKMMKGIDGSDANGVKGSQYFALLSNAFGGDRHRRGSSRVFIRKQDQPVAPRDNVLIGSNIPS